MDWATFTDDFAWAGAAMVKFVLLNCVTARRYFDEPDFATKFILFALTTRSTHETVNAMNAANGADSQ